MKCGADVVTACDRSAEVCGFCEDHCPYDNCHVHKPDNEIGFVRSGTDLEKLPVGLYQSTFQCPHCRGLRTVLVKKEDEMYVHCNTARTPECMEAKLKPWEVPEQCKRCDGAECLETNGDCQEFQEED